MAGLIRNGGYANVSSDSASKFVPQIWSGKLVKKFYAATVFGSIANTDYEGEISAQGDKVIIRTTPNITISDYEIGQTLVNQQPISPNVELNIDKGKYFSFILDDVDKHQSDIALMDKWSDDAGQQMKVNIDSGMLSTIYTGAHASNAGATAGLISGSINLGATGAARQVTAANVLDAIIDAGTVLDEQNTPDTDRYLVLPAWACALIKKSDLKDASLSGDSVSPLRNGRLGMIDRFTIYMSNQISHAVDATFDSFHCLAGHKSAMTFASQMTKMETLRAESTFGNIVRGLNVYGYSVIKPESLVHLYIRR